MILDCVHQITRKFDRGVHSKLSTNGLILSGRQLNEDEEFFIGDVQMLSIADSPDEAYHICTKYAPDCSNGKSNRHSNSQEKYSSGTRLTSSRSSRITSTRENNKKKKQNLSSAQDVTKSTVVVGHSIVINQNEPMEMVQIKEASRSNKISQSSVNELGGRQFHERQSISSPKEFKLNNGSTANFVGDSASYSDDYFDSIDESFYDEVDLRGANLTNERTGKCNNNI